MKFSSSLFLNYNKQLCIKFKICWLATNILEITGERLF